MKNVRADCGCAGGAVDATELAPGASTTIRVIFRTLTMSGTLHKRIMVDTNDPARPTAELKLKADVFQGIVLAPARFFFGDVAAGARRRPRRCACSTARGTARRSGSRASRRPDLEFMTVDPKPCDDAGWHGYELTATFKSPAKVGTVSGVVIVRTDDPKFPRFTVPVQAFVSGKIWLDRRSISMGIVPAGRGRETAVIARAFGKGVDLGTVTAKARRGVVEAKAVPSGKEWVVTIRLPEQAPPGRIEDVVEITSSIAGEPAAEVLVVGSVTEPPK